MTTRSMHFIFRGFTGWETVVSFLPWQIQLRWLAIRITNHQVPHTGWRGRLEKLMPEGIYGTADLDTVPVIIQSPWGCYRIVNRLGDTEPWKDPVHL